MSVIFPYRADLYIALILNLSLVVFMPGQIVTVGNGMVETGIFRSIKLIVTGQSCHFIQTFLIDAPQNQSDRPNATNHQSLFNGKFNSKMEIKRNEVKLKKMNLSVKCRFLSAK